eukprot:13335079-Ditylum_brightwellii.AAC.1
MDPIIINILRLQVILIGLLTKIAREMRITMHYSTMCKTDMKKQSGVAISGTAKYVHTVLSPLDME